MGPETVLQQTNGANSSNGAYTHVNLFSANKINLQEPKSVDVE